MKSVILEAYEIKYYNLNPDRKKHCNNYKNLIDYCNKLYNKIKNELIMGFSEMTVFAILNSRDCEDIAEGYLESSSQHLANAGEYILGWNANYQSLKKKFNKIKSYGVKLK